MAAAQYAHSFRFDPTVLKPGDTVLEHYPALGVYPELVQYGFGKDDWALRYAIYLGEGSGLHKAIQDYTARKREALRLSGLKPTDSRYEGALNLTDQGVQELRWAWLRLFSSRLFRQYIAACQAYDENCQRVEKQIADGVEKLPEINIYLPEPTGKKKLDAEASERMLGDVAMLIAGKKSDMKEDAIHRAIKLRNELIIELSSQNALLENIEQKLFFGDEEMKKLAAEKNRPQAISGSIESLVFGK